MTGLVQDHCQEKDDAFKKEFKRFRRPTPEDMKQVIDFNQPEHFKTEVWYALIIYIYIYIYILSLLKVTVFEKPSTSIVEELTELGLQSIKTWKIFTLKLIPGN